MTSNLSADETTYLWKLPKNAYKPQYVLPLKLDWAPRQALLP